ncbi:Phage terminase large subunit [Bacillus subtilis J26]|nr:Phage terminase large subunit [Bacillus subtilis J24]TWG73828.1 Phage terminase large subunit [Bacillus subtilis J26]
MIKQVNPHFKEFLFDWNQKFHFLVGGYGSSKSYHMALKIVLKLLKEKRTAPLSERCTTHIGIFYLRASGSCR